MSSANSCDVSSKIRFPKRNSRITLLGKSSLPLLLWDKLIPRGELFHHLIILLTFVFSSSLMFTSSFSRVFLLFFLFIIFFSQPSAISNSYPSSGFTSLSLACLTRIFPFAPTSSAYSVAFSSCSCSQSVRPSDFCPRLTFSLHTSSQYFIMHFHTIIRCETHDIVC